MSSIKPRLLQAVLWDWQGTIVDESDYLIPESLTYLKKFKNLGISQGVITNGDGIKIRADCISKNLASCFDLGIISRFDGYKPKPSPEMFLEILKPIKNVNPKNILFIGDSLADSLMANEVNCHFMYEWEIKTIEKLL